MQAAEELISNQIHLDGNDIKVISSLLDALMEADFENKRTDKETHEY